MATYEMVNCYGEPGAGKTTYLSKLALSYLKIGWNVFTIGVHVDGCHYIEDVNRLGQSPWLPPLSLILIDESGCSLNNQMVLKSELRTYFKNFRHAKHCIWYFSQDVNDTNIVLRRLTMRYVYLKKFIFGFSCAGTLKYRDGIKVFNPRDSVLDRFHGYGEQVRGYKMPSLFDWHIFFRPIYYKYFDSYILPEGVEQLDEYET